MEDVRSAVGSAMPSTDEDEALRARELYRQSGIPALAPDTLISPHLTPGEQVLGAREAAAVRRVEVREDIRSVVRREGPLYVTDRRLLQLADRIDSIALLDIDELTMTGDRILLTLAGSHGVTLDVADPHQFRVLIAAAKAALRTHADTDRL